MTSKIDSLKWDVLNFAFDPATRDKINEMFNALAKENANNFEAILPVAHVDMHITSINWCEKSLGEDYETQSWYTFEDPVTGFEECVSAEKREELLEQVEDDLADADQDAPYRLEALMDLAGDINGANDALDWMKEQKLPGYRGVQNIRKYLPALRNAIEVLKPAAKKVKDLEKLKENIEDAESEYSELLWNLSWRPYGDDVNTGLIDRIPQVGWGRLLNSDEGDGSYLTLTCCGQDNGPALMAYVILEHGVVPHDYVKYWTGERGWTRNVIGTDLFLECAEKLGVRPQLEAAIAADDAATKKKKEEQEAKDRAREEIRARRLSPRLEAFFRAAMIKGGDTLLRATVTPMMEACGHPDDEGWANNVLYREWEEVYSAFSHYDTVADVLRHYFPQEVAAQEAPNASEL